MKCTLCNRRKPSRRCPAKEAPICSRCCGSKRKKEIECPPECGYLSSGREGRETSAARKGVRIDRDAFEEYRKGMRLCLEKDYESALKVFDGILARYPGHVPSLIEKGNCLLQDRKIEDAGKFFERALENDPDSTDAMNGKALCLFVSGDIDDALDVLDNALDRAPKDCGLLALKADCLLDIDRPLEAKSVIEDVLKRERENDHALVVQARAQFELSEFEEAGKNLERAIKIKPDDERYGLLADTYFEKEKPEEGFEVLGHMKDKTSWFDRGRHCLESGFEEYAISCCDRGIEAGEDSARCSALKARVHILKGEESKAGEFIDAALEIDPDCIEAVKTKMAMLYADDGTDDENTLEWVNRAIEINPEDVGTMFLRAKILKDLDRPGEFLEAVHETRELIMDFDTFWKYGIELYIMEEYKEAAWFLEEALDLRDEGPLRDTLTSCYSLLNDVGKMESCIVEAEKAHPDAEWLNISKAVLGYYKDDMKLFKESLENIGKIDGTDGIDGSDGRIKSIGSIDSHDYFDVGNLFPDIKRISDFLDAASRVVPDNPYVLMERAEVAFEMGDEQGALAFIDQAISLKKSPMFHVHKIKALIRMNLLEDALETARTCPDDHVIPILEGIVFKKMGREEDARRAYDEYLDVEDIIQSIFNEAVPELVEDAEIVETESEIERQVESNRPLMEVLARGLKQEMIIALEELVTGDEEDV